MDELSKELQGLSPAIPVFVLDGWPDACGYIRHPVFLLCLMCFLMAVVASHQVLVGLSLGRQPPNNDTETE